MPYSAKQLKLFGIALAMKRGEQAYSSSEEAAKIARMTPTSDLVKMIAEGKKKK
jgi:hypothetical protein